MNSFGNYFRMSIFGESHGISLGILIDGCPAGIIVDENDFTNDIQQRKSGQFGTTKRLENDVPVFQSGIFNGRTTGSPIMISFVNSDQNSLDYPPDFQFQPRPGHSDFAAYKKYNGFNDYRGGGHFSGRLTLALIAAGVLAKKITRCEISSKLIEIAGRLIDEEKRNETFEQEIKKAQALGDSIGGIVETTVSNVPAGLGEPFFGSVESLISSLVFAIPGVKAIEFGLGFASARKQGSQYNDQIMDISGTNLTNNSGGITGGLTNGNNIVFRTALHPTSSIRKEQNTIDLRTGEQVSISTKGRHDTCFALRVPPVISAATACVLADLSLAQRIHSGNIQG